MLLEKLDLLQGTLGLMVLQTLTVMGSMHGYGLARRIEQVSGNEVLLNQGPFTLRSFDWKHAAGSPQHGEPLRITARQSSMRSAQRAAASCSTMQNTGAVSKK
jgi:hypothetical protein